MGVRAPNLTLTKDQLPTKQASSGAFGFLGDRCKYRYSGFGPTGRTTIPGGLEPPKRPCRCLHPLSPHQKRCEAMFPEAHPHVLPSLRYHSSGTVLQAGSPDSNVGFLMSGKGVGAEAAPQRRIRHRNHQPLPTLRGHPLCIGQGRGGPSCWA